MPRIDGQHDDERRRDGEHRVGPMREPQRQARRQHGQQQADDPGHPGPQHQADGHQQQPRADDPARNCRQVGQMRDGAGAMLRDFLKPEQQRSKLRSDLQDSASHGQQGRQHLRPLVVPDMQDPPHNPGQARAQRFQALGAMRNRGACRRRGAAGRTGRRIWLRPRRSHGRITLPGFIKPCGSSAVLIARIIATATGLL
ncbi:hypothetical protein GALL_462180 [mine drainage metagenome]|uniref:Uncharacterized protein n=1 Tax=mine drainage metagenome TaxID=410659 RepID=A0A1J5PMX8_9ZZZZ